MLLLGRTQVARHTYLPVSAANSRVPDCIVKYPGCSPQSECQAHQLRWSKRVSRRWYAYRFQGSFVICATHERMAFATIGWFARRSNGNGIATIWHSAKDCVLHDYVGFLSASSVIVICCPYLPTQATLLVSKETASTLLTHGRELMLHCGYSMPRVLPCCRPQTQIFKEEESINTYLHIDAWGQLNALDALVPRTKSTTIRDEASVTT